MTYLPGIPSAGDIQSVSQGQFQTNFQQLENVFDNDHYAWDYATVALRGFHLQVTLPQAAADPTTAASQVALYSKSDGTNPQLFYRRQSAGTAIQMTSNTDPSASGNGYSFLPGRILIQWGLAGISGSTNPVTFSTAFSGTPWSIVATPYNNNGNVTLATQNFSSSSFTIYSSSSTAHLSASWVAIGPAL